MTDSQLVEIFTDPTAAVHYNQRVSFMLKIWALWNETDLQLG